MSHYNKVAGRRVSRIEALSDGVFAIAMTILVFDLKDPLTSAIASEAVLLETLFKMAPRMLTYCMSFLALGIFWMGHSTQYHFIKRYDRNLSWMSIIFLMFTSLVPFSTTILSGHLNNKISILPYWLNLFFMGGMLFVHWSYAFKHGFIETEGEDKELVNKAVRNRIIWAQSFYAGAAILSLFSVYLSIATIILVQLNYAFAPFEKKGT